MDIITCFAPITLHFVNFAVSVDHRVIAMRTFGVFNYSLLKLTYWTLDDQPNIVDFFSKNTKKLDIIQRNLPNFC